jgi:hypothetical protein
MTQLRIQTPFTLAIAEAPADAEFIVYGQRGLWTFICRRDDDSGCWNQIGQVDDTGFNLIAAGISASRKSLWNANSKVFETGTLEQLRRTEGLAK